MKREKISLFCRSYGQKIAVVANGEKGDISEIVEKLEAYLATHVKKQKDWLLFCQYKIIDCRAM